MKTKIITAAAAALAIATLSIAPAFAQSSATSTRPGRGVSQQQRMAALGARGEQEIDVRVASLTKLITRIQGLRNVSDAQKSTIVSTIQGVINNLNTLKTQVANDTSTTTLHTDTLAITQNYRVYALVMPQLNIIAASDRIVTIATMLNVVSQKLQARLTSAAGLSNLSSLQSDLADLSSKISDATKQAQAAVTEVSALAPDQGDKTVMASNTAALKDARSKLKTAQQDLVAARKDAVTIIQGLVKWDKSVMSTGSSTPPVSNTMIPATPTPTVTPTPTATH